MMELEKQFASIFPESLPVFDVTENPFSVKIVPQAVLYPTRVCMLTARQFACLQDFLNKICESSFFITDAFMLSGNDDFRYTLVSSHICYSEYCSLHFMPATAICSVSGKWGIAISDEQYAVAGCVQELSSIFHEAFLPCSSERDKFAIEYAYRNDLPNKPYNHALVRKILQYTSR